MRLPRLVGIALASTLAVLGGAGPAVGCSLVPPPLPAAGDVSDLRVAFDRAGGAVALWRRYDATTRSHQERTAIRGPDGAWTGAAALVPSEERAEGLRLAFDAAGRGIAVWRSGSAIRAAVRAADGTMGAATTISAPAASVTTPIVAVDPDGNALAVWLGAQPGEGSVIQAASRPAGGAWGAPQDLSAPGEHLAMPTVAVGPGGRAVVTWVQPRGGSLQATDRPSAAAPFGPAVTISGPGVQQVAAAVGPPGQAVIVWTARTVEGPLDQRVERSGTQAAEQRPDGTWSPPHDLAGPFLVPLHPVVCSFAVPEPEPLAALDGAGNAVALWAAQPSFGAGPLQWASRDAGGDWTPAADVGPAGWPERLALGPAGDAVAVWTRERRLEAARRPAGGVFGPVEELPADGPVSDPFIGVDARGRSLALWVERRPPSSSDRLLAAAAPAGGPWSAPVLLSALREPAPAQPVRISDVSLGRVCPRAGRAGERMPTCGALAGAVLSFHLSAPARVRVTLQRGGRGAALRSLTVAGRAGVNRLRIPLGRRLLGPGRYLMRVAALGAGGNAERVVQVDAGTR